MTLALPQASHTGRVGLSSGVGNGDRRRIVSVRTRIVATITLVTALGMAAVVTAVYLVEYGRVLRQIDERLTASLASARYIVEQGWGLRADGTPREWPHAMAAAEAVVQRMSPDDNTGAVGIAEGRATLVPGVPLDVDLLSAPGFLPHLADTVTDEPRRGTYADDGVTWRYVAIPIHLEGSPPPDSVLFAMAYDVEGELAEVNGATQVYLIASGIVLLVIAGAAWAVAGRLLRPLRRMRETADQISARSLAERLPVEGRDDVSELASTMNAMLDRLDAAMNSQRQLLSDVGHELKTPITIVRGYIEVMDANDPADVRETQELATDELDRMARLVQDLASTARLHGPAPVSPHPTDAGDLVQQIARKAEGIEGARITRGPIADVVVSLDAARITQAMLQLAQNGVTHGGGDLEIGSTATADELLLWLRDHGPGVAPSRRTAIFERFNRSEGGGSGLGLNIVDVIARAHGGSVAVTDPSHGPGAVFTLTLPRDAQATVPAVDGRTGHGLDSHRR